MSTFLGTALETLVFLALVLANGFFVAAEFALVKVRASQLRPLANTGGWRVKFALMALDRLAAALSATQFGITLASLGLGWVGEPFVAHRITPLLARWGITDPTTVHSIAFVVPSFQSRFFTSSSANRAPRCSPSNAPSPSPSGPPLP